MHIERDAFADMNELIELDLSNNLIYDFPDSLQSNSLQTLDLSMCRWEEQGGNQGLFTDGVTD